MASIIKIPISGLPFSQAGVLDATGSTHGVVYSSEIIGGYQEVATIADRDNIPVNISGAKVANINEDLFSSGRRRVGMVAFVANENKSYRLLPFGYFGNGGILDENDWSTAATHYKVLALDTKKVIRFGSFIPTKGYKTIGPITGTTSSWGIVTGYTVGAPVIDPNTYSGSTVSPWVEIEDVKLSNSTYNATTGELTYNLSDGSTANGYIYDTPHLYTLNINVGDTKLTVNNESDYESGNNENPDIYVTRGEIYIFRNDATGHTIEISRTLGDVMDAPVGLVNNTAAFGTDLIFKIPQDAYSTYYYYSTGSTSPHHGRLIVGGTFTGTTTGTTGSDSYVTGGTSSSATGGTSNITETLQLNNGKPDVTIDLSQALAFRNNAAVKKTVGGITTGDSPFIGTGMTLQQIVQAVFYPAIAPTISFSSASLTKSFSNLVEIGYTADLTLNASFTRGTSVVSGQSTRSMGLPIDYNYTGDGIVATDTNLSSSLTDSNTILSYTVAQGANSWSLSVNYNSVTPGGSTGPVYDDGSTYVSTLFTNSGTKTATASLEGVYPVYAATATTTVLTKQALVSMLSGNNLEYQLVAEVAPGEHTFALPDPWTGARPLTGVYYFNTVSNLYDPGNKISDWGTTSITKTIEGNSINYTQYTKLVGLPAAGTRKIKLVF